MNLVSVIIPVYNAEKYIERAVASVLSQSYKNLEIILVDDGSKDNSSRIIDRLARDNTNIKVIHKQNGGSGSARNVGIENSTGNYILFLDSDDFIEVNTIEKLMNYSKEYDIVCCGFDRVDEVTKKVFSNEMVNMPFDELEINNKSIMETAFLSPACWGKLFKRKIIEKTKFSNNTIEDILFFTEIMPKVKKIKFVKEVLWHYIVNQNSLIMNIKQETADMFEKDLILLKQKYLKNNYSKEYMDYLTLQVFIHNCISIPSRLYNNKDVNIKERIKHIKEYMNDNFKGWKHLKIKIKGRFIKKMAIYVIIFMYKINIFRLFLFSYNFMINKLKIDVKW